MSSSNSTSRNSQMGTGTPQAQASSSSAADLAAFNRAVESGYYRRYVDHLDRDRGVYRGAYDYPTPGYAPLVQHTHKYRDAAPAGNAQNQSPPQPRASRAVNPYPNVNPELAQTHNNDNNPASIPVNTPKRLPEYYGVIPNTRRRLVVVPLFAIVHPQYGVLYKRADKTSDQCVSVVHLAPCTGLGKQECMDALPGLLATNPRWQ